MDSPANPPGPPRTIGELRETSLHAALKALLAQPGDLIETPVEGYVVDIARGSQLFEIQTGRFSGLKPKLAALLPGHQVRLVYPVAQSRWVVRAAADGTVLRRRKSPVRGVAEQVFRELVSIPKLALHPHFSLEVLLIEEEQIWRDDGRGSWRRQRWSIADRRLLRVIDQLPLDAAGDYQALLPPGLPEAFTTAELAEGLGQPRRLAGQMVYCLREMGLVKAHGKRGRAVLYRQSDPTRTQHRC
ncbi:MAG: hypothetical protein SNJ59_10875 [Aggregatilineales bacterium]